MSAPIYFDKISPKKRFTLIQVDNQGGTCYNNCVIYRK